MEVQPPLIGCCSCIGEIEREFLPLSHSYVRKKTHVFVNGQVKKKIVYKFIEISAFGEASRVKIKLKIKQSLKEIKFQNI